MTKKITVENIHPDPRSANVMDNEVFEKLKNNIQHVNRIQPIIVRPHPKKAKHYIIIDGYQRLKVAQELGWTEISADIWEVDEQQAALLLASLNRLRGEDHPFKRAELIQELLADFDKDQLCTLIPESTHQIDDLIALLQAEEASVSEALERHIKEEQATLPETLTFVLVSSDAQMVRDTLIKLDEENPNNALVQLCLKGGDCCCDETS